MTKVDFGNIFMVGAITYGCAFLINGPFIDKFGGRRGMLIGVAGSIFANAMMELYSVASGAGKSPLSLSSPFSMR